MANHDYYRLLGVARGASPGTIRTAYRRLALQVHPDRNGESPQSVEQMMALNAAYAVLSDPQRRRAYDAQSGLLDSATAAAMAGSVTESPEIRGIFDEIARRFGLRPFDELVRAYYGSRPVAPGGGEEEQGWHSVQLVPQRSLPRRALRAAGRLARRLFDPADCGAGQRHRDLPLTPRQAQHGGDIEYCPERHSNRRLRIRIPPGLREGQRLKLAGLGRATAFGTAAGDLILTVRIQPAAGRMGV